MDTASYSYTADDYSQSVPYLTGSDYGSLQGMDSTQPFVFHLSPFTTGSSATFSFIFLTIFDRTTNSYVFNDGFLAATTSSITLSANALAPGDQYIYEIDYSNRDSVPSPGASNPAELGFEVRTQGQFSTAAVSEPSTAGFLGFALVALAATRAGRRFRL